MASILARGACFASRGGRMRPPLRAGQRGGGGAVGGFKSRIFGAESKLVALLKLAPDMHHGPRGGHEIWFADVVTLFFLRDDALNEFL